MVTFFCYLLSMYISQPVKVLDYFLWEHLCDINLLTSLCYILIRTIRNIVKICRILHMLLIYTEVNKICSRINTCGLLAIFEFPFSVGADFCMMLTHSLRYFIRQLTAMKNVSMPCYITERMSRYRIIGVVQLYISQPCVDTLDCQAQCYWY